MVEADVVVIEEGGGVVSPAVTEACIADDGPKKIRRGACA